MHTRQKECRLQLDEDFLYCFEKGLDPQNLSKAEVSATILGFGEISTIFQIGRDTAIAYKRMPLFKHRRAAETYVQNFEEYCRLLKEAGLRLPLHAAAILELPHRPVVCYIAQEQLFKDRFGHKLIHSEELETIRNFLETVVAEIEKVFKYNRLHATQIEIALDGQISNWHLSKKEPGAQIRYIDTGTPLYRKNGIEQLDPELFLKSAPSFLRWIIRLFFLDDVMNRYYDLRQVSIDLAANLYKERRPDLIPLAVDIINGMLFKDITPVTEKEVKRYYQEDKIIWALFLAFRKVDRWLTTKILRKRYEFILPEDIKR